MKKYLIVIERAGKSYGAYVPDIPGCVAAASTKQGVRRLIRSALAMHIKAMREDGDPIPEPTTQADYTGLPA